MYNVIVDAGIVFTGTWDEMCAFLAHQAFESFKVECA